LPKKEIPFNNRFKIFYGLPDPPLLSVLVSAYKQVFSEEPWQEIWSDIQVLTKLHRELRGQCFLVIMEGNERWPVAGFAWGALTGIEELEERIGEAIGLPLRGMDEVFKAHRIDKILYFDEFAILQPFRRGLEPIRFLLRPGLELGMREGVSQTLFWSTPESRITPLALLTGYEPILRIGAGKKEIIFLFHPDVLSLLKMTRMMKQSTAAKIMRLSSLSKINSSGQGIRTRPLRL
jgi:hypothetical protein